MSLVNYFINVNSKNRISPLTNSPSDYRVYVQDLINLRSKRDVYVTPVYVYIPPTWYNITSKNNKIIVVENTAPATVALTFTVTIPQGNYNVNDFITALTTQMTAQSALFGYTQTYTGTYNSATGFITITQTTPAHTFTYQFGDNGTDLAPFLGFSFEFQNQTYVNPNTGFVVSPDVVNFTSTIPSVYIRSNFYRMNSGYDTNESTSGVGGASDVLCVVPILNNGFSAITWEQYNGIPDRRIKVNGLLNQQLNLKLTTDDPSNIIDLNGSDWQMTLLVQYVI
jgi:hypothetical protein